jgi:hypothetical protein
VKEPQVSHGLSLQYTGGFRLKKKNKATLVSFGKWSNHFPKFGYRNEKKERCSLPICGHDIF